MFSKDRKNSYLSISDYLSSELGNVELPKITRETITDKDRVVFKNKLKDFIPNVSIESKDKKEFLKQIFKAYDDVLFSFSDDMVLSVGKYFTLHSVTKIIEFLRFKKGLNYKERINMLKELCDMSLTELISNEKMLVSYMYEVSTQGVKGRNKTITVGGVDIDSETILILIGSILIYRNTIVLLKCVLYDYYKYDIVGVKDGKIQKRLLPKPKTIYTFNRSLEVSSDAIDLDRLLNLLLDNSVEMNRLDFSEESVYSTIYSYLDTVVLNDEYGKLLLDSKYNDIVKNRLCYMDDVYKLTLNSDYMVTRKVLLPKSGVVLLLNDHPLIESILLKEVMYDDKNHMVVVSRYKDGSECINTIFLDVDYTYAEWVSISRYECGFMTPDSEYMATFSYVCDFLQGVPNNNEYEVISPTYWKYRGRGYKTDKDVTNSKGVVIKREFEIEVAPFLRKITGVCGVEAKKLAKELGIVLEEGYTIVKPHTRTYNKVNK